MCFTPNQRYLCPCANRALEVSRESRFELADHFARHGADFGASSADEYAGMASRFLQRAQREGLPTKVDSRGTIRVYDPKTNAFGSYNANGTTKTFYKPDPASYGYSSNADYWNAQPGSAP